MTSRELTKALHRILILSCQKVAFILSNIWHFRVCSGVKSKVWLRLRNFALAYDYEELLLWMESTDKKFIKSKGFYVFQEELLGQMEELHSVTEGIVSKPVLPPPALKIEVL